MRSGCLDTEVPGREREHVHLPLDQKYRYCGRKTGGSLPFPGKGLESVWRKPLLSNGRVDDVPRNRHRTRQNLPGGRCRPPAQLL